MLENYGIAEFFGIFLVFFPLFIFLSCVLPWGIFKIFNFVFGEKGEVLFHHHFHYKDRR